MLLITGEANFLCDGEGEYTDRASCRIRQDTRDDIQWDRRFGKTPSGMRHEQSVDGVKYPVTGPTVAAQGTYYMYIETSIGMTDQVARYGSQTLTSTS